MVNGSYGYQPIKQSGGQILNGNRNLRVIGLYMLFKALRLNEITCEMRVVEK